MRNGTTEIELPFPIRSGFLSFFSRNFTKTGGDYTRSIKRKIGFSFDQRSMFQLLQNNEIDLSNHSDWLKKTNQSIVVLETMYAGAQSYCIERRLKDNFTKKGLQAALIEAGEETVKELVKCWQDSEQLGYKKIPGKKKAKSH